MSSDTIYKSIGFFVAILAFIYIVTNVIKFQTKIIEGNMTISEEAAAENKPMTDEEKAKADASKDQEKRDKQIASAVDSTSTRRKELVEILNTSKYKENYDDILYNVYKSIQLKIIDEIVVNANDISYPRANDLAGFKAMEYCNTMNTFLTTLNSASDILGKMK
jgi:hypothetical protein